MRFRTHAPKSAPANTTIYAREDYDTVSGDTLLGAQFEVRWALADRGVTPGNPALFFESITLNDRPDKIEPKVFLGGEVIPRCHWAANLVAELELGGRRSTSTRYPRGCRIPSSTRSCRSASKTSSPSPIPRTTAAISRRILVGPSFQWRPVPALTANVAPLFGVGTESPDAQLWLNGCWEI